MANARRNPTDIDWGHDSVGYWIDSGYHYIYGDDNLGEYETPIEVDIAREYFPSALKDAANNQGHKLDEDELAHHEVVAVRVEAMELALERAYEHKVQKGLYRITWD
jgi:hypothetical protein